MWDKTVCLTHASKKVREMKWTRYGRALWEDEFVSEITETPSDFLARRRIWRDSKQYGGFIIMQRLQSVPVFTSKWSCRWRDRVWREIRKINAIDDKSNSDLNFELHLRPISSIFYAIQLEFENRIYKEDYFVN